MKHSIMRFLVPLVAVVLSFASCEKEEVAEELVLDGKWELVYGSEFYR